MNTDVVRAGFWAVAITLTLVVLVILGSRNLAHFDAALVGYTFATLFATFGITYRYAMWLQRPPTRMYWRRGWRAFLSPRAACSATSAALVEARGRRGRRQPLHLPARPPARARPLADHVGLPARRRDHVSARLGLDPLRDRARAPRHYRAYVFGFAAGEFPRRLGRSRSSSSTAWCGRRSS